MNKAQQRTHGAILYTRVSTGEQDKNGTSPETQLAACRAKALAQGLPIIAEYHDGGVSGGFLLARPGMQRALADIGAQRADTLICANLSRYSRDVEHQQAIKKAVRAAGGRLVFCDMDFDDTPEGDLAFGIMGGFAEYEKSVIKKRTDGGRVKRAEDGLQPSRRTSPYGYHIVSHTDVIRGEHPPSEIGRYFLREDQARVARWIWAAYHAGTHSLAGIARQLTLDNVPTPGRSAHWSMTTVRYILANPVYKGVAVYGRFDNWTDEARLMETHWRTGEPLKEPRGRRPADPSTWVTMECPALVSEEVWDAVQVRLTENKAKKGGNPQRVRMLAGRVLCPHCGAGLVCGSQKRRNRRGEIIAVPQRYACGHYMRSVQKMGTPQCEPTGYYVAEVEQAPIAAILDAAQRPEVLAAAALAYSEPFPNEDGAADARCELAAVDQALAKIGKEEGATVQAQIAGIMAGADPGAYAAAFADLAARRKDMEDRRGALSRLVRAEKPGRTSGGKSTGARERGEEETGAEGVALDRQALADTVRVLTSPDVPGAVKRDAIGHLIESVTPRREAGGMETTVRFLPGVLGAVALGTETLQTIRLGSDSTRALFSSMSASSWAASGKMRLSASPPENP